MLSYASVISDGVVVGKNGALTSAWMYKGADDASSTNEQREVVSRYINSAITKLNQSLPTKTLGLALIIVSPVSMVSPRDTSGAPLINIHDEPVTILPPGALVKQTGQV